MGGFRPRRSVISLESCVNFCMESLRDYCPRPFYNFFFQKLGSSAINPKEVSLIVSFGFIFEDFLPYIYSFGIFSMGLVITLLVCGAPAKTLSESIFE